MTSQIALDAFIARRYLSSSGGGRFLSFITWVALGGIIVGVTALVVVIGVMTGMHEDLQGKILGSTPHIVVLQQGSSLRMDDWRRVMDEVKSVEGVSGAAPFLMTQVNVLRLGYTQPADLYGVALDPDGPPVTDLEAQIQEGVLDLGPTASGLEPVVLGSRLAARMGLFTGDTVQLMAFENLTMSPMGMPMPAIREFEVAGTFETGMFEYDIRNAYAPLAAVQEILGVVDDDQVSGLGVRTTDPDEAVAIAAAVGERLGFGYYPEAWVTTNRTLFSALKLEKLAMGLILSLIVIVAAFNIVSTLVMVVVDRTREIGILKSMGMTDLRIMRVFMLQGVWIGVIGTLAGVFLGMAVAWTIDRFEIIKIPAEVYFVDKLPISIHAADIVMIVVISIAVCFLATIYPALRASGLQPVEAIRHE